MENLKRSVTCGELSASDAGKTVVLNGWVHRKRDHGGINFINVRDRYGITQVVVDEDAGAALKEAAGALRFECCVAVRGTVRGRPAEMVNPQMPTGEIEVAALEIAVLSGCEVLPFMVEERSDARDDLRLRYRYLDLRSFAMQRNIRIRSEAMFRAREYLRGEGFFEIETPTLIRSTPEGARDFLVPSRIHAGRFYALPQSPQLYKQLLMVSGFDKYFQIARCYRDEDARGDRQLEFTQIDMEMSFVSREDVFRVTEGMLGHIFRHAISSELPASFPRLSWEEAMDNYGSDKPDLRFDLRLRDFGPYVEAGAFGVFKDVLAGGGAVKVLVAPGCGGYSRKQIAGLEELAKSFKAQGLAWAKVGASGLEGGIAKFYEASAEKIIEGLGAREGDLLLFAGAAKGIARAALGAVRSRLGKDLGLARQGDFKFAWIVDFPLFEWNGEENKWDAAHHMFSMPREEYLATLEQNPGEVKGDMYDLVCNGYEIASGSIRIHDAEIQKRVFSIVGYDAGDAGERFGFLLEAFRYGPPPHGGIAPGFDRLVMLMCGETTIRDVIAFPKNTVGVSPMDEAPSAVEQRQLDELHLMVKNGGGGTALSTS
ncbi:MAG: aspartate--tRNA ligase [Spirochaetia bacterium]|jgi:aspartyl-tRNA synthetase|nr:aspartate--tRNA ligase [Spirochaetia bacterium]